MGFWSSLFIGESTALLLLFALSSFVSAALLFWIEPMFAKMILPMLGGTPSVWNTCLAFYQLGLLAGYIYTHLITKWLGVRNQTILHLALLLLVLIALPIGIAKGLTPPVKENPIPWLSVLLLVSVGLPFFVISTTAPLLQKWFATTGHPWAKDPYFLYSASNLGSMVALLGYPFLLEPFLPLAAQSGAWSGGYILLVVLISGCAMIVRRAPRIQTEPTHRLKAEIQIFPPAAQATQSPGNRQRIRWVLLAFAPSSLLLGVTNYISIDIAQIPLLWIIPLAIYLLTFILVFMPKPIFSHRVMLRLQPFLLLPLMIPFYWGLTLDVWFIIPFHLLLFFVIAMVCHGELANSRPPAIHLTEFYLWLSVGGVLGGLFNALIAPMLFNTLAEYPLVVAFACLLRPSLDSGAQKRYERWLDLSLPLALGVILIICKMRLADIRLMEGSKFGLILIILISCSMGIFLYSFRNRSIRFGAGIGAVIVASFLGAGSQDQVLHSERNFFGILKVLRDPSGDYHLLYHGTTLHGTQSLNPDHRHEPLTYFHRTGPLGQVFAAFSKKAAKSQIAIIGLGAGTIACYGNPGQHLTFYEIDPAVERIARESRYFTFLSDCSARVDVVLGDARLSLAQGPSPSYDLMVLDAFSSDAIPIHLVTREALKLYLSKLADGGILAFHISNRYLDLKPVLGDLAQDANLACYVREDLELGEAEKKAGKAQSIWVVMSRRLTDLGELAEDLRWKPLPGRPGAKLWTDDYSNIPSVLMWSNLRIQIERIKKVF